MLTLTPLSSASGRRPHGGLRDRDSKEESMPKRIQRKRTRGWRMPEGAVSVTRPGRWGNPYRVTAASGGWYVTGPQGPIDRHQDVASAAGDAVSLFRVWLTDHPDVVSAARRELAGRDLACWCPLPALGEPDHCHAAVLLEIANTCNPALAPARARPTTEERHDDRTRALPGSPAPRSQGR